MTGRKRREDPSTKEFKFWKTQPVPKLGWCRWGGCGWAGPGVERGSGGGAGETITESGPIDPPKTVAGARGRGLPCPIPLVGCEMDTFGNTGCVVFCQVVAAVPAVRVSLKRKSPQM